MTQAEAKQIIRDDPSGSIFSRLDALEVAYQELGDDATIADVYRWAEANDED